MRNTLLLLSILLVLSIQVYSATNTLRYQWPNYSDKPLGKGYKMKTFYNPKKWSLVVEHLERNMKLKRVKSNMYSADFVVNNIAVPGKLKENQMLNIIPGTENLDNKARFGQSLKEMDQKNLFPKYNSEKANPRQYPIDLSKPGTLLESEKDFLSRKNRGMWILKPAGTFQGQGIYVIKNISELEDTLRKKEQGTLDNKYVHQEYILQQYIVNPLLFNKKKFDLRFFIGIVSSDPLIIVYFDGYTRKTLVDYDPSSDDLKVHLGNGDIQKTTPGYWEHIQRDHNYDMRLFKFKLFENWPHLRERDFNLMMERCKAAITYGLLAAKDQIGKRKGFFQLMSIDFIVRDDFMPFLVEFNTQPYIVPTTPIMEQIFPDMAYDWMDAGLALNEFSKEEIMDNMKQDPKWYCQFIRRNKCVPLINDAIDFNYLQTIDFDKLYP